MYAEIVAVHAAASADEDHLGARCAHPWRRHDHHRCLVSVHFQGEGLSMTIQSHTYMDKVLL